MTLAPHPTPQPRAGDAAGALDAALLSYWEDPLGALAVAIRCQEAGRSADDAGLQRRALALQGAISLHRGDLHGAFELVTQAERLGAGDLRSRAELAALNTHLHFFSGSYAESLDQAERAVELADRHGDPWLRSHARRMACLAFGNIGVADIERRIDELLALTIETGSRWEEALARNDLGHLRMVSGDHEAAEHQLTLGITIARSLGPRNRFALGVLHCTHAELRLETGAGAEALADAERAIGFLTAGREANPYLLAMTVLVKVRALLALGRVEVARQVGEHALEHLGDRVPHARSMVLGSVAHALRGAGRTEEAFDALARGAELERQALQEFSHLRLGLQRARMETAAVRRQAYALRVKNAELEALVADLGRAHGALEERTRQLEHLQDQLREQADRDWLTGLRNRRFLARARDGGPAAPDGPLGLAVVDLDHFKTVNDRFGHHVGDRVLIRVAELLVEHLRSDDVIVRTGGEEFTVLMPGTEHAEAVACCERVRAVIAAESWDGIAPGLAVTASIGVVSAPAGEDLAALERVADERLYAAKRAGRNRVAST